MKPANTLLTPGALSHEALCADPVLIFRCDDRALRNPALLEILLRIASAYLVASRALVLAHAHNTGEDGTREDVGQTLLLMQQSAVIQILLELCLPADTNDAVLVERQSCICSFIHGLFLDNPQLIRLVHFQVGPFCSLPKERFT